MPSTAATSSTRARRRLTRIRTSLAGEVFGVPETRVRVVSPDLGGGFGLRATVFSETALVLWAARRLGRPVKWNGERTETFLTDDQARDMAVEVEIGLDGNAMFRAVRLRSRAALGAYLTGFGGYPAFVNLGSLAGPYRTPAICAEVDGVFTTATPTGPYRGAGRPETTVVLEHAIDRAAYQLGIDRGGAAAAQPDRSAGNALPDRPELSLRLRGLSRRARSGARPCASPRLRITPGTFPRRRPAARARDRLHRRAVRRRERRERGGAFRVRRHRHRGARHPFPRAGARNGVPPDCLGAPGPRVRADPLRAGGHRPAWPTGAAPRARVARCLAGMR